jgi:hypothetical protein
MPGKHDWKSWDNYLAVHQSYLRDYEHFILSDQLEATPTSEVVDWDGVLYCCDGIEIHVRKLQDVELTGRRPMVRTREYSYQVLRRVAGREAIKLFRYDNIHRQPGHADYHHKHRFAADGTEIEPPAHIGEDAWPTLSDVIKEIYDRWVVWRQAIATDPVLGRDQPAL